MTATASPAKAAVAAQPIHRLRFGLLLRFPLPLFGDDVIVDQFPDAGEIPAVAVRPGGGAGQAVPPAFLTFGIFSGRHVAACFAVQQRRERAIVLAVSSARRGSQPFAGLGSPPGDSLSPAQLASTGETKFHGRCRYAVVCGRASARPRVAARGRNRSARGTCRAQRAGRTRRPQSRPGAHRSAARGELPGLRDQVQTAPGTSVRPPICRRTYSEFRRRDAHGDSDIRPISS